MLNGNMKKHLFVYMTVGIIIVLSFLIFSSNFYPLLNSDDAISVLMTHYFKLPNDFYFWGQDRYGSLIPLIGQFFFKIFNFSALTSESISHYLILILGYFSFSTLFKSNFSKIVFAMIWFFPLFHFIGLVRYNFGVQYSLIGIAIYLINYISKNNIVLYKKYLLLCIITLSLILSVWVSDTAILTIFIILALLLLYYIKQKGNPIKLLTKPQTYFTVIGFFLCALFIWYAKSNSVRVTDYNENIFNNVSSIYKAVILIRDTMIEIFTFKIDNPVTCIYAYFITALLIFFFFFIRKKHLKVGNSKWINIFILDGFAVIFTTLVSAWALKNNMPRRYFTGAYISFWLAFLLYIDNYPINLKSNIFKYFIVITVLIGSYSPIHYYINTNPKSLKSSASVVKEFESLGEIGIISEYWNSYITTVTNPDLIKATPNEWSTIRNHNMIDSVFAQPKLFVIKDMWLDSFPDTLIQLPIN